MTVRLDEIGPEAANGFPGRRPVPAPGAETPRRPTKHEADDGRRGNGYVFGAFQPATGEAFTTPYAGWTTANTTLPDGLL